MDRRDFLITSLATVSFARFSLCAADELEADLLIVGGGVGGTAAALGALRNGLRVILSEETDWLGGQLTQQAVPPDEHPWIEQFGATRTYLEYRRKVRQYYRHAYPLKAHSAVELNPGNCSVSRICHEPRVARAVIESMLAPYVSRGQLTLLLNHRPVRAEARGDRVETVELENLLTGSRIGVTAPFFVDATELGELLPLAEVEHVTGAESREQTGEPHAASEMRPDNMQAITWCFAVEYEERKDHTIEKPANYDFWQSYRPDLEPAWPGPLLSFTYSHPITLEPRTMPFDPKPGAEEPGLWRYRRLIDPSNFEGDFRGVSLINWPQNDYWLGNLFGVSDQERDLHLEAARQLSRSLLYWLQTEAPRSDGGMGWPGLRPRGDLTGTVDGLAKRPYIRESRRIKAEFTVLEQHVGTEARKKETGLSEDLVTAEQFYDSVGIGSYRIDLHPSTGGDNYIDISSLPFQIPLGALIPIRVENLIPACKNIGTTHITNGCYRLHPVEWNIGEAAGELVAFSMGKREPPRKIRREAVLLDEFQTLLRRHGFELDWPTPKRTPR